MNILPHRGLDRIYFFRGFFKKKRIFFSPTSLTMFYVQFFCTFFLEHKPFYIRRFFLKKKIKKMGNLSNRTVFSLVEEFYHRRQANFLTIVVVNFFLRNFGPSQKFITGRGGQQLNVSYPRARMCARAVCPRVHCICLICTFNFFLDLLVKHKLGTSKRSSGHQMILHFLHPPGGQKRAYILVQPKFHDLLVFEAAV